MESIPGSHELYLGAYASSQTEVPFDRLHDLCQCCKTKRKEHDLCRSCGARRGVLRRRAKAVFRKIMKQKKAVRFYLPDDAVAGTIRDYHDDVWWEERLLMLSVLERKR